MTEEIDLPEKLTAQPEEIVVDIYKTQRKNKNIIYTKIDMAVGGDDHKNYS